MAERTFQFFAPLTFFQKGSAPEGQRRRIAGVISTEDLDKQGEVIVQKGLDFQPFLTEGWLNDNHSKKTTDVLGYPEDVVQFQKGDKLPDGAVAKSNCTWMEGYLLDTPDADKVWNLGMSLAKAGSRRRLGYSIEGAVRSRTGPGNRIVAKALVRNVAITNCPVGQGTRLELLAKSLDEVEKGLSMGTAASPGDAPSGPQSGEGAGQVLARESLEQDGQAGMVLNPDEDDEDEDEGLSKSTAIGRIQNELGCSRALAEEAFTALVAMKAKNLL